MWPFGEESVYECMLETYIPLLNAIGNLWDDGIPAKITLGITPILAEQLSDEHFKKGFEKYLDGRITAAKEDEARFTQRGETPDPVRLRLARFYLDWFTKVNDSWLNRWNRDIIGNLKKFQDLGAIELTTSAATHCFSPLVGEDSSLQAQFKSGVDNYKNISVVNQKACGYLNAPTAPKKATGPESDTGCTKRDWNISSPNRS
jgi:Uncharacterized conserved protein